MACHLPANFVCWQDKFAQRKGHVPHPEPHNWCSCMTYRKLNVSASRIKNNAR